MGLWEPMSRAHPKGSPFLNEPKDGAFLPRRQFEELVERLSRRADSLRLSPFSDDERFLLSGVPMDSLDQGHTLRYEEFRRSVAGQTIGALQTVATQIGKDVELCSHTGVILNIWNIYKSPAQLGTQTQSSEAPWFDS